MSDGATARLRTSRRRVLTIRARLSLSYAGLVAGCGAVLIAIVYLYMRYVPTYELALRVPPAIELDPTASPSGIAEPRGLGTAEPGGMGTARSIEIRSVEDILDNLLIASLIALGILIMLGGAIGWVMAGRIIRPLAAINAAATRAASGTLHHRLDMGGPHDEIRELSLTFDRMLESLERAFDSQKRFAANASHELRSPLTTVKTMIDVTLAEPDVDPGQLRALAERIRDVNQSNIDTVEALLDLSAAGAAPLVAEPVNLTALVIEASTALRDEMAANGLTLTAPEEDLFALGNPVLLGQAVSNLLRNATRHNRPGGEITVATEKRPAGVRISVSNTGAMLSEESVARLAEPFARAHGRTLTRGSGHGLGLAIVDAIARAHGGTLTLEANAEGGLTARLDVPAE